MSAHRAVRMTKAQHKQLLFKNLRDCVSIGLQYTTAWSHEPSENGFLDWINDIVKILPFDEESVPQCTFLMFNNIMKRSKEHPLQIIENIDISAPPSEPAQLICSDGTSSLIEQVPSRDLPKLPPGVPFQIKGNCSGLLPVKEPFILKFTPAVPVNRGDRFLRGVCYDVERDGQVKVYGAPPVLALETACPSNTSSTSNSKFSQGSLSHEKIDPPIRITTSLTRNPRACAKANGLSGPSHSTSAPSKPSTSPRVPTKNPQQSRTIADAAIPITSPPNTIPFPIIPDNRPSAPHSIPSHCPSLCDSTGDFEPSTSAPDRPFNHFPPHPQANAGRVPLGERVGLQRTYAFVHKSHPELFWAEEFGDIPQEGERRTVEDCLPSPLDKPIRPLQKVNSSPGQKILGPALTPFPPSSIKKGKKRVREYDDDEVESRPAQRIRADSASHTTTLRFSRRIRNVVRKFTGGTLSR